MQVNLNRIVASKKPIRTTWSEEEMEQLVDSIKQWGVIQPVKLRPLGDDHIINDRMKTPPEFYEIVDGHRRVEAARRVGLEYIEVLSEDMDDQTALIQSLIANVQREDMNPVDIGMSLNGIKDVTQWSNAEISRNCNKNEQWVSVHLALANDDSAIQSKILSPGLDGMGLSEHHARAIRKIEIPTDDKVQILEKAQEENLGWAKTERVAESVKVADDLGDTRAKEALIAEPYSPLMHDPEIVKERHERFAKTNIPDPMYIRTDKEQPSFAQSQQSEWDRLPRAKVILDYLKKWNKSLADFRHADEIGKLSPEGKRFIIRRLQEFSDMLTDWQQSIEDEL